MTVRTVCRTVLTVWAMSCSTASVLADDGVPSPTAPVEEGYRLTMLLLAGASGSDVSPWRAPYRDKLFSRAFAALLQRDEIYQEESGSMGHLDVNPFLNGQAGEIENLHVAATGESAAERTEIVATFQAIGQRRTVRFPMVLENSAWRIDDIIDRTEGRDYSIVQQLDQPYPCGSFMRRPCR